MKSKIYFSSNGKHPRKLAFSDNQDNELVVKWKRVWFKGIPLLIREVELQYLRAGISKKSIILLAVRNQLLVFFRNPSLAFREIIFGYEASFEANTEIEFPIHVIPNFRQKNLWVSRNAVVTGIHSNSFGADIEWNRLRFSKSFDFFIWGSVSQEKLDLTEQLTNSSLKITHVRDFRVVALQNLDPLPPLKYLFLNNCEVINGVYTLKDTTVYLTDPSNAIEEVSWPTNKIARQGESHVIIDAYKSNVLFIASGVFLGSSSSWYHFLVEVLPRFLMCPRKELLGSTVIVRGDLPSTIKEVLLLLGFKEILSINDGQKVKVEKLQTVLDFRLERPLEIEMRKSDLELVKAFFADINPASRDNRYVYLKRQRNLFRPLYRQNRVERYLLSQGFEVVSPEELTLFQQIQLFRETRIVVSESGAALTNMLFMEPKSLIIEINPGRDPIKLWSRFATTLDLESEVIEGRTLKLINLFTGVGMFKINFKEFKKTIEKFA